MQTNFTQFVKQYRLNEARKSLADDSNSSLSLTELALKFGFGTRQSFYNAFLQEFGITPSEFRNVGKN
jgi:AraC family transcriptional activator of tynA and feaB